MSLTSVYKAFLADPNADALAQDAALHYVNTVTTVKENNAISKHLASQRKMLTKKSESVIGVIENDSALCLDVETKLEFLTGGGAYLPGLEENFLADRVVVLPILHVVHFNAERKIQQIRLYWDQGSLLKAVDIIGSRGNAWPIKDSKDQIRLISSNAVQKTDRAEGQLSTDSSPPNKPTRRNPTNDPHSSLSLFAPKDEMHESEYVSAAVAPRASARPAPRDYGDLFVGERTETPAEDPSRPVSPSKENHVAPKLGAGKNYHPSRLFDMEEPETQIHGSPSKSPSRGPKPHPTKYSHFEFSDGHDEPAAGGDRKKEPEKPRPRTKHQSQWDFEDFNTPAKPKFQRSHQQNVRHFAFDDDSTIEESPAKAGAHPRRDAETHFEFKDDGDSGKRVAGHPRGQGTARSTQLYENNLYDDNNNEGGGAASSKSPSRAARPVTSTATSLKDRKKDFDPHFEMVDEPGEGDGPNGARPTSSSSAGGGVNGPLNPVVNLKDRKKDFEPHFQMTDSLSTPVAGGNGSGNGAGGLGERTPNAINRPLGENRSKAVKMMEASWEARDPSPIGSSTATGRGGSLSGSKSPTKGGKENIGIRTGGDGMGGRKGAGRGWGIGDESAGEEDDDFAGPGATAARYNGIHRRHQSAIVGGRKPGVQKTDNFWEF